MSVDQNNFWEGKRVAVTGASGFIGSWLTNRLLRHGADVTILLRKGSPRGHEALLNFSDNAKVIYGDVRDYEAITQLIIDKDVIFHLAAITQVIFSKIDPVIGFSTNVGGTINVLEALRNSNNGTFLVYMSTDKVYGEPNKLPIDEQNSLSSKSPYDASKLAADRLVFSYQSTYGTKSTILRPSNTVGGHDANFLRIVPGFVRSIINGEPPKIRGNGHNIRDYMYVKDVIRGLMLAGQNTNVSNGEVFNFGTGIPTSVFELANLLIDISGNSLDMKPIVENGDMRGEIYNQFISSKKAKEKLGWRAKYCLEDGLRETFLWYSNNKSWFNVMDKVRNFYGL